MKPGIHAGLPMESYLALPAASASLIKAILNECPRKAWAESWLNPERLIAYGTPEDRGTIAHALLLEGDTSKMCVIDPNDHPAEKTGAIPAGWTNKSIRAARDQAREDGKIPVLKEDAQAIEDMAGEAIAYIQTCISDEPAIWAMFEAGGGVSEETLVWDEAGLLCKARPDRRSTDWAVLCDYKTTQRSVEPGSWGRTQLLGMGYYLSAAWYRRGVLALTGVSPAYVFLAQEVEAPYLCSLVGVNPAIMDAAGLPDPRLLPRRAGLHARAVGRTAGCRHRGERTRKRRRRSRVPR
jgi:hypothetical protein